MMKYIKLYLEEAMLSVIYGPAGSGKTTVILSKIKEAAIDEKEVVYIVPEQFSFESERSVLTLLSDKLASKVTVLSFSSLADTLTDLCGGGCRGVLSDCDKIMFMSKTLKSLKDELPIWRKNISSTGFASKITDMIGEFKISAIFPDDIDKATESLTGSLKEKMKALALAYRGYDALVKERFIDPADKLQKLYDDLCVNKFFEGKEVYIDGFKGFTGQQYRVIDLIASQCDSLCVAILSNKENKNNLFDNTLKTAKNLKDIAKKYKKEITEEYLENTYFSGNGIKSVEKILCAENNEVQSGDGVTLCSAKSAEDEVKFIARSIRKLVRENGYRYKDFVVIARNPETYENYIEHEFRVNDISCFFDKRVALNISPVYSLLDCAMECAVRFSSDSIFRFLKSGLALNFTDEQISTLENYVYLWDINGDDWYNEWDMDPTGFSQTDVSKEEEIKCLLNDINEQRTEIVKLIGGFKRDFNGNVKSMSKALVDFLTNAHCAENMKQLIKTSADIFSPEDIDVLRQSWELIMNVLDGMVRCFGDDNVSAKEYREMFALACSMTTVGRIPQMLDEVAFGAADRIRPSRPKVAFVLGANYGVFPAFSENNSILSNNERKKLLEAGFELRDKTVFQTIEENLLVYSCLCCADEKLYISYHETGGDGKETEPAHFVLAIKEGTVGYTEAYEPMEELSDYNYPETKADALRTLCVAAGKNNKEFASLSEAINDYDDLKDKFHGIYTAVANRNMLLSEKTAQKLYGNNISLSATKFDTFHTCKFRYFCQYGLNTKIIQPAKLDNLQRGTIVHFVIEQFCNAHLKDIKTVKYEQIVAETDKYLNDYFAQIKGSEYLFTSRFNFLLKKIKEGIVDVLKRIVAEFIQSKFTPECCEVKIGNNGTIPTVQFPFSQDGKMSLYGSIDRLDRWGSFIRIIDYKTGSKTFKLSDTLYGQNLQMLIYLYCVIRGDNPDYKGSDPAGILYLISKKDMKKEGMAMNGLICENIDVVEAMEKDNNGEFIPKLKLTKSGAPYKNNNSYISAEAFDVIFDYIEELAAKMGSTLHSGNIAVEPIDAADSDACKYCQYSAVCGIEDEEHKKIEKLNNSEVIEAIGGGNRDGF